MFPTQMSAELGAMRHAELIAAADAARLARQARLARHAGRRFATTSLRHRIWVRTTTQPAHF